MCWETHFLAAVRRLRSACPFAFSTFLSSYSYMLFSHQLSCEYDAKIGTSSTQSLETLFRCCHGAKAYAWKVCCAWYSKPLEPVFNGSDDLISSDLPRTALLHSLHCTACFGSSVDSRPATCFAPARRGDRWVFNGQMQRWVLFLLLVLPVAPNTPWYPWYP